MISEFTNSPQLVVLLATRNGATHLRHQLDSLRAQAYTNWQLLVRDDLSSDETPEILAAVAASDPRVRVVDPGGRRVGSCQNFARLLELAKHHPYLMFCDQDDVWLPTKISVTLARMRELESTCAVDTPLLVHTAYRFVDEELNPLPRRIDTKRYSGPSDLLFSRLLSQNFVYGCTTMLNSALARIATPIAAEAEQHDYWVALIAAAVGRIAYLPDVTVLYRQHHSNVTEAYAAGRFRHRVQRVLVGWREEVNLNARRRLQAQALERHLGERLPKETRELLRKYISVTAQGGLRAARFAYRNHLQRQGSLQSLRYYISLIPRAPDSLKPTWARKD